jgi:hypothetical protein
MEMCSSSAIVLQVGTTNKSLVKTWFCAADMIYNIKLSLDLKIYDEQQFPEFSEGR